jgi:hypothetical protein
MLGTADFTATTGTTVVLASGATTGDLIRTESFYVSSVLNAIPATAGSINSSYLASGVARANWGAGGVLQVVQAAYASGVANSTSTYADTNLAATITPSSSTSKILVIVTHNGVSKNTGNANSAVAIKLVRNSTDLSIFARYLGYTGISGYNVGFTSAVNYLDLPATTSAVTYKTQFANEANAASVEVNANGAISYMTLMEIAA